jgi:integrase
VKLFKRNDVYWFSFRFKKKRYRRSTHLKNRQKAENVASAFRTKLINEEAGIKSDEKVEVKPAPTFGAAMKDFLAWSKHEHAAHPATHRRYEVSAVALEKYFLKSKKIDEITSEDVEHFKTARARQKTLRTKRIIKPATVNRELACLKALFNYFLKGKTVTENPVKGVRFLAENNEQMRVLTREEEKVYLLAASQPLKDIAVLMLEGGFRPEEVCRIRRENVNIGRGFVFNPYGKTKAAKRKIPLTRRAAEILRHRLEKVKGEYLFPGRGVGDQPIIKVNNAHASALERSKVKRFRIYDLRHTFATRATEAGVDLVTLAALLGHSRVQMVMRYSHPSEEHQFAAIRKLESAASGRKAKTKSKEAREAVVGKKPAEKRKKVATR